MRPDCTPLKTCTKCCHELPATAEYFSRNRTTKDGLRSSCKECQAAYKREHCEEDQGYSRKRRVRLAAEREAHHDKAWWDVARSFLRTTRLRNAPGTHSDRHEIEQYRRQRGRCFYCGCKLGKNRTDWHADHVVPLAGIRTSSNGPENIVAACPRCNTVKQAADPMDFAGMMF